MRKFHRFIKYLLCSGFSATLLISAPASADPPVLPPGDLINVPTVFCFKVTGGDVLPGGGARIQFEVLNWTGEDAYHVSVSQSPFGPNTGGAFDVNSPDPLNSWHTTEAFDGGEFLRMTYSASEFGSEAAESPAEHLGVNPLPGIDLDPNNDLDFLDAPSPLPDPLDSGPNALDGFILEFPEWDVGERIILQWDLFNEFDFWVDSAGGVKNPFSFGTFQMDRASDGSLRIATFFSIGTTLGDVGSGQTPIDPNEDNWENIVTLPATAMAVVPVPAAFWLMMSGLLSLGVFARKSR